MAVINRALQRLQGLVWGDGTKDTSVYIEDQAVTVDALGRDAGSPAFRVRGLSTANAPTDLFVVDKSGGASWPGQVDVRAFGAKGDGVTDDTAAVRRAITAAAAVAGGGTVVFPGGPGTTYLLGPSGATYSLTVASNMTLRGEGAVLKRKSGNTEKLIGSGSAVSDLAIRGLTIDNQDALVFSGGCLYLANGASRVLLEGVRFTRLAYAQALYVDTGTSKNTDIVVRGCEFTRTLATSTAALENVAIASIHVPTRVHVDRCRFDSVGALEFIVDNTTAGPVSDPCRHVYLTNCTFERIKCTCVFAYPGASGGLDDVHVENNGFFNVGKEVEKGALLVGAGGGTTTNVVVRGNVVHDWGFLGSSGALAATPNAASAMQFVSITGLVVAGNTFDAAAADGTSVTGGNHGIWLNTGLNNVVCAGNSVINCGYTGIRLQGAVGVTVSRFAVTGNTVRDCARLDDSTVRYGGIFVEDYANYGVIGGNLCLNNGSGGDEGAGIALATGTSATTISDILIQGNSCYDSGAGGGGKFQRYGIRVGFTASSASAQPTRIHLLDNNVGGVDVAGGNEVAGLFYQTTVDLGYVVANNPGNDAWLAFAPTWTGFSANPSNVTSRYRVEGKIVTWQLTTATNGTSNATGFTATLPVAAKASAAAIGVGVGVDNGAAVTTPVRIDISTTVATFYPSAAAGNWTASGGKSVNFTLVYEAA